MCEDGRTPGWAATPPLRHEVCAFRCDRPRRSPERGVPTWVRSEISAASAWARAAHTCKPRIRRPTSEIDRMRRGELESRILILVTLALVAFGIVCVYSATSAPAAVGGGNPNHYVERQGMYALLGIVLMVVAQRWDYRRLRAARARARPRLARPAGGGARDRALRQRRAPLDRVRPRRLPALGAREARAGGLGCRLPLAPSAAALARAALAARSGCSPASTPCFSWPSRTSGRRSR